MSFHTLSIVFLQYFTFHIVVFILQLFSNIFQILILSYYFFIIHSKSIDHYSIVFILLLNHTFQMYFLIHQSFNLFHLTNESIIIILRDWYKVIHINRSRRVMVIRVTHIHIHIHIWYWSVIHIWYWSVIHICYLSLLDIWFNSYDYFFLLNTTTSTHSNNDLWFNYSFYRSTYLLNISLSIVTTY